MTRLAIRAGMEPARVADLDEDEFDALMSAVREREREQQWGNLHELVATCAENLWAIMARLDAGIAVVQVKESKKVERVESYPRPPWMEAQRKAAAEKSDGEDVVVVHSVREALGILKMIPGGKDGA